jgi:hypothetical protein
MSIDQIKIISLALSFISYQVARSLILVCVINIGIAVLIDLPESGLSIVVHNQSADDLVLVPACHPPLISCVIHGDGSYTVRSGRGCKFSCFD